MRVHNQHRTMLCHTTNVWCASVRASSASKCKWNTVPTIFIYLLCVFISRTCRPKNVSSLFCTHIDISAHITIGDNMYNCVYLYFYVCSICVHMFMYAWAPIKLRHGWEYINAFLYLLWKTSPISTIVPTQLCHKLRSSVDLFSAQAALSADFKQCAAGLITGT